MWDLYAGLVSAIRRTLNAPIHRPQGFEDDDENEYENDRRDLPQKLYGPRVFLRDRQSMASGLILKQQSEPFS